MGNHRGDADHVPFAVAQRPAVEDEGAGTGRAVYKFPAFVGVAGNVIGNPVLSHIGNIVHRQAPLSYRIESYYIRKNPFYPSFGLKYPRDLEKAIFFHGFGPE
jgi:hypothetical protein